MDDFTLRLVQAALMILMGAGLFARADGLVALSRVVEGRESAGPPGWWSLFPFKFLGMALICAGGVGAYYALIGQ